MNRDYIDPWRRPRNGEGMEHFTTSAWYSFVRWAPLEVEDPRPQRLPDMLHKTPDYDVLHKGLR